MSQMIRPVEGAPAHIIRAYQRLSDRQRAFALALPLAASQKAAARMAGYSPKTAEAQAFKLAQHPDVRLISEHVSSAAIRGATVTVERTLQELADVTFLDPAAIFTDRNSILPITEWPEAARRAVSSLDIIEDPQGRGRTVKVRFAGKIEAADKLLRALGAYAPERTEHTHRIAGLTGLLAEISESGGDTGPGPSRGRRRLAQSL